MTLIDKIAEYLHDYDEECSVAWGKDEPESYEDSSEANKAAHRERAIVILRMVIDHEARSDNAKPEA